MSEPRNFFGDVSSIVEQPMLNLQIEHHDPHPICDGNYGNESIIYCSLNVSIVFLILSNHLTYTSAYKFAHYKSSNPVPINILSHVRVSVDGGALGLLMGFIEPFRL
jgi:hypothetical protein